MFPSKDVSAKNVLHIEMSTDISDGKLNIYTISQFSHLSLVHKFYNSRPGFTDKA